MEKITLTPKAGQEEFSINLHGDLAGILTIANEDKSMKEEQRLTTLLETFTENTKESVTLVAGAGFEPATFGL